MFIIHLISLANFHPLFTNDGSLRSIVEPLTLSIEIGVCSVKQLPNLKKQMSLCVKFRLYPRSTNKHRIFQIKTGESTDYWEGKATCILLRE